MKSVGAFGRYRGGEVVQGYLGRPEWKKTFGRTGHGYNEVIKIDFQAIEWSWEMDWTGVIEWSTDGLL